jgi:hypothetical protein
MHFLSDVALWESLSEFVTPDGKISNATGESEIIINGDKIEIKSWAMLNDSKITNFYSITKITETKYTFISENRIPSTNSVLLDDPLAPNFAACEKIRSIVKRRCTWP